MKVQDVMEQCKTMCKWLIKQKAGLRIINVSK